MDMKLEVVVVPVSDVDRARDFYTQKLGFDLDVDHQVSDEFRVVQLTPTGSACSVTIGVGLTDSPPGTAKGMHLVVDDAVAAHAELAGRGVDMIEVHHFDGEGKRQPGPDPERRKFGTFSGFSDPDGNTFVLQEVPPGAPEAPAPEGSSA
jgi:catechol 2,3-dioxygenase-like lactoylglutathione lyase family enzyme